MKRVLLCAVFLAWSGLASAVVYKWVDGQGKIQYGDRPPDGVHAEVVEMLGVHGAHTAATPPARPASPAPAKSVNSGPDDPVKKSVDDDVQATRAKQCADAQDRYKRLIEGRKLYKAGPDGARQYLSSEEIDSERVTAKQDIDTICNSDS